MFLYLTIEYERRFPQKYESVSFKNHISKIQFRHENLHTQGREWARTISKIQGILKPYATQK